MSIQLDTDGVDLSGILPRDLVAPRVLKRALSIAPDSVYELHQYAPELHKELRDKINRQLQEARRKLDDAKTTLPVDVLNNIENELRKLREQIEQLLDEQVEEEEE